MPELVLEGLEVGDGGLQVLAAGLGTAVLLLLEVEVRPPVDRVEAPVARPVLPARGVKVPNELLWVESLVWKRNEKMERVLRSDSG